MVKSCGADDKTSFRSFRRIRAVYVQSLMMTELSGQRREGVLNCFETSWRLLNKVSRGSCTPGDETSKKFICSTAVSNIAKYLCGCLLLTSDMF